MAMQEWGTEGNGRGSETRRTDEMILIGQMLSNMTIIPRPASHVIALKACKRPCECAFAGSARRRRDLHRISQPSPGYDGGNSGGGQRRALRRLAGWMARWVRWTCQRRTEEYLATRVSRAAGSVRRSARCGHVPAPELEAELGPASEEAAAGESGGEAEGKASIGGGGGLAGVVVKMRECARHAQEAPTVGG
jgi:hypothetical protein